MTARPMLAAEVMALRALSELDQLEGDWMACIATGDPVAVSEAMRLLGLHLMRTMRDLQLAMAISDSELALTTAPMTTRMSTN